MSDVQFIECGGNYGGAVYIADSSPVIERCAFLDCQGDWGGGLCFEDAGGTVADCVFYSNRCWTHAGAVMCFDSDPVLERCVIRENSAIWGGALESRGTPTMSLDCCTIAFNEADDSGGGLLCYYMTSPAVSVRNCIFWGNLPDEINVTDPAHVDIACSDVAGGWTGEGNFAADPRFCMEQSPDDPVSLLDLSPCVPGNHPDGADCGWIGAREIGCYAIAARESSWSQVKSLYTR